MENKTDEINIIDKIKTNPNLTFLEVLDNNSDRCSITLLGKIVNQDKKEEHFVLKIKKKEFSLTNEDQSITSFNLNLLLQNSNQIFHNDVYYKLLSDDLLENKLKVDLIYPADSKVIDKYKKKGFSLFTETAEIYYSKTLKYIESIDPSHTQWIRNILYNRSEEILYEEKEVYQILQDYNSKDNPKILNCLGIPYNNKLRSLRDLNGESLDLLLNFYYKGREALSKRFDVEVNQIRCFIHYPPSFYYFHVHYLHIDLESNSTSVNRAIDLFTIIQNIKMKDDYYQKVDMEVTLQVDSKLYNILNNK